MGAQSKRGNQRGGGRASASARPAARSVSRSTSGLGRGLQGACVGVARVLAALPSFAFFGRAAWLVVPAIAGVVLGLAALDATGASVGSVVFSLLLTLVGMNWLTETAVMASLVKASSSDAEAAKHFSAVISKTLFTDAWLPLVHASDPSSVSFAVLCIASIAITLSVSLTFVYLRRHGTLERLKPPAAFRLPFDSGEQVVGFLLMVVVLILMFVSMVGATQTLRQNADTYWQPGGWATDYGVYAHTVQNMSFEHMGYYAALENASKNDRRALTGGGPTATTCRLRHGRGSLRSPT